MDFIDHGIIIIMIGEKWILRVMGLIYFALFHHPPLEQQNKNKNYNGNIMSPPNVTLALFSQRSLCQF